jgi:hypothetical protein
VSGIAMEDGAVTLEATFALTMLVPVLFAILQFGGALQRWSAQDAIAVQAARQAAELGGDSQALRLAIESSLRSSGIDPASVTVSVEPRTVGWREPIRVRLRSEARIVIPFLLTTALPLSSSAVARGELAR